MPITRYRRQATIIGWLLFVACRGAAPIAATQPSAGAEANQLHTAIVNGDVESLRYWLEVRHADASSANTAEPDVTPLERCVGLAARSLDGRAAKRGSRENAAPAVSLPALQEIARLLHEHGARLTDADRQHVSGAVLRWYDEAVSSSAAPPPATPAANPPSPPASSDKPVLRIGLSGAVAITVDSRASCNGSGHPVYVVNHTELSVMAFVTAYEDGAQTSSAPGKSDSYTVDANGSWRLGCDTAPDGRHVRYELTRWR